jgi:hypothetical protein
MAQGHVFLKALGHTWDIRHVGGDLVDRARLGAGPVLYVFTHGVLLPLAFTHRNRSIHVLISESKDGEVITRITERLGFVSVRGSTSKGGERAILRMASRGSRGYDLAITPDGPRGPRGSVAGGVALVASRGELPIVPLAVAADRAFRARSWDRFLVPLPGARVWVVYRAPIRVERAAEGDALHALAKVIEASLQEAEEEAIRCAQGGTRPERALQVPA